MTSPWKERRTCQHGLAARSVRSGGWARAGTPSAGRYAHRSPRACGWPGLPLHPSSFGQPLANQPRCGIRRQTPPRWCAPRPPGRESSARRRGEPAEFRLAISWSRADASHARSGACTVRHHLTSRDHDRSHRAIAPSESSGGSKRAPRSRNRDHRISAGKAFVSPRSSRRAIAAPPYVAAATLSSLKRGITCRPMRSME